ncbi:hypothetical protein MASR2M39_10020 [Ignavibacteriales bacterium]
MGKNHFPFLKPNGQFVFVEFHLIVWMFDDNFEKVGYNYFKSDAIVETENGTYADKSTRHHPGNLFHGITV